MDSKTNTPDRSSRRRSWAIPVAGTQRSVPARVWVPLAAIGLVITAVLVFRNNYAEYVWPKNWGVVEQGRVYRSGLLAWTIVEDTLRDKEIDLIINLQGRDPNCPNQMAQEQACKKLGVEMVWFPMRGNGTPSEPNVIEGVDKYASALETLVKARNEGKRVLVQCGAGTHRTGGIIASYRMLFEKRSEAFAYRELCHYKWKAYKHQALPRWVNAHMRKIVAELVERGVLDKAPEPIPLIRPS